MIEIEKCSHISPTIVDEYSVDTTSQMASTVGEQSKATTSQMAPIVVGQSVVSCPSRKSSRRLSETINNGFRSTVDLIVLMAVTLRKNSTPEDALSASVGHLRRYGASIPSRIQSSIHDKWTSFLSLILATPSSEGSSSITVQEKPAELSNQSRFLAELASQDVVKRRNTVKVEDSPKVVMTDDDNEKSILQWWMEPEFEEFDSDGHSKSGTKRCHIRVESLFSTASGFNNFRGLLNLGLILLVVSNFRVALENIIKYGIIMDPFSWIQVFLSDPYYWPSASLTIMANGFVLVVYYIEVCLEKGRLPENVGAMLNYFVLGACIVFPSIVILDRHPNPFFSCPALMVHSVVFLKLWSYTSVNMWCRQDRIAKMTRKVGRHRGNSVSSSLDLARGTALSDPRHHSSSRKSNGVQSTHHFANYPDTLTLSNLYYFILAPTLCYELNYPRTINIRKRFLLKRALEFLFLSQVMICLTQQWIIPLLRNSLKPLNESDFSVMMERMLKLAIPNHLIWLMGFYVIFHSALNVCAELLRFGDRLFYKDWWNSESVTEFWSTWNIPVHRWARRHVYIPLLQRGMNKMMASIVVFLISAFFHELIVSVPLRMFRLWAFMGMIGQVPYAMFVSKYLRGGQLGNLAVWISLIIGQPLALMMYFHDYYIQQNPHIDTQTSAP